MWLLGPEWLSQEHNPTKPTKQPQHSLNVRSSDLDETALAERKTTATVLSIAVGPLQPELTLDATRFSSWPKLVRTTAYVLRILDGRRQPSRAISAAEFENATTTLVKDIQSKHFADELKTNCRDLSSSSKIQQYKPFVDDDKIIRARTRLEKSADLSFDEKYPIILPGDDPMVNLLIRWFHTNRCLHVGGVSHF